MSTKELTTESITDIIESNQTVLVDFWAPWCGPCQVFKPIFSEAAGRHEDVVFATCNTEEQPEMASAFQIRSIPTLMAFRNGKVVFSQPGALPAELLDQLVAAVKEVEVAA